MPRKGDKRRPTMAEIEQDLAGRSHGDLLRIVLALLQEHQWRAIASVDCNAGTSYVLVCAKDGQRAIARLEPDRGWRLVTAAPLPWPPSHWMELPDPPPATRRIGRLPTK